MDSKQQCEMADVFNRCRYSSNERHILSMMLTALGLVSNFL